MVTYYDLNSTRENSCITNSLNDFHMYGEKIKVNSNVLQPYNPKDIKIFRQRYKLENNFYCQKLTPTNVYTALDMKTGNKVAVKELSKNKMSGQTVHEFAKNEFAIHYSLSNFTNCRNIVKVIDYFEDEASYYMVMEYSPDHDFFEDLLENKYRPISDEKILKAYAFDILNAINEIHKNNIIHCDIKPQNYLLFYNDDEKYENDFDKKCLDSDLDLSLCSYDANTFLKLTDFGLSHIIPSNQDKAFMKIKCGTFGYCAPEISTGCFIDKSVDIWSFGLSLYQMAVAYMPTAIKQYKYDSGPIPFRKIDWNGFAFEQIKNLIELCMEYKSENRITVSEALNHPWFDVD